MGLVLFAPFIFVAAFFELPFIVFDVIADYGIEVGITFGIEYLNAIFESLISGLF